MPKGPTGYSGGSPFHEEGGRNEQTTVRVMNFKIDREEAPAGRKSLWVSIAGIGGADDRSRTRVALNWSIGKHCQGGERRKTKKIRLLRLSLRSRK